MFAYASFFNKLFFIRPFAWSFCSCPRSLFAPAVPRIPNMKSRACLDTKLRLVIEVMVTFWGIFLMTGQGRFKNQILQEAMLLRPASLSQCLETLLQTSPWNCPPAMPRNQLALEAMIGSIPKWIGLVHGAQLRWRPWEGLLLRLWDPPPLIRLRQVFYTSYLVALLLKLAMLALDSGFCCIYFK